MAETTVNPVNGIYTIRGINNRNLELTLQDSDLSKYIVVELDGEDLNKKLPSDNPLGINWFAGFGIYNNDNGNKGSYATVTYSFTVTGFEKGQRLFVGYGGQSYEVTDEMNNTGKVTLSVGDPGTGGIP